jgi:hypothetical protein
VNRANSSSRDPGVSEWQVRVHHLGEDPGDDLTDSTTPAERIVMVWELTARAWSLTGHELPEYGREETPIRVLRPA